MNRINLILIAVVLSFGQAIAQGGSVYTRFGLGDLYLLSSARNLSLGGVGTSLGTKKFVNTHNPATWSSITDTKFSASLLSNMSNVDDGINSALYSSVRFTGFSLAFPIKEDLGIGFVLGIAPYSVINYDVQNSYNSLGDNSFTEDFIGNGGISKVFFGASYMLPLNISIGATFDYYTGNAQYKTSNVYDNEDLLDSYFISDFKYKGLGSTIGILTPNLSSIFNSDKISDLRIGVSYEMSGNLNTDSTLYATTSVGKTNFVSESFFTVVPAKLSIGLNFNLSKFLVNLDYINQPWSKFEQNGQFSVNLKDLNRYSIGVEYDQHVNKFGSFWDLVKYRGGLSFEQTQFTINGTDIEQLALHAGVSFPLGYENSVDIGLMYGIRGTSDQNLLKENILKASFTLNLGELWFVRQDR